MNLIANNPAITKNIEIAEQIFGQDIGALQVTKVNYTLVLVIRVIYCIYDNSANFYWILVLVKPEQMDLLIHNIYIDIVFVIALEPMLLNK